MALASLHLDCVHVRGHIHDSEEKTEISLTKVEPGRKCSCWERGIASKNVKWHRHSGKVLLRKWSMVSLMEQQLDSGQVPAHCVH